MTSGRRSHGTVVDQANYSIEFLRFMAGEGDRPSFRAYGLTYSQALREQQQLHLVVENAYMPDEEFEGTPPDPDKLGVDPNRAAVIISEMTRLAKKAYDRQH